MWSKLYINWKHYIRGFNVTGQTVKTFKTNITIFSSDTSKYTNYFKLILSKAVKHKLYLHHTFKIKTHRDSGNFVKVARLLVYMCPPTSMCTGALDLVSCAGVGMPWLLKGDTGDRVIMGLDILERLSCWKITRHHSNNYMGIYYYIIIRGNNYTQQSKYFFRGNTLHS